MTEFETIKQELTSLGYTMSAGRGDHKKFDKPGKHTITVSMSVNQNARGYQNCIANIRKQEPSFSLGKQQCHLKIDREEPATILPQLPKYKHILPENKVRYTYPENMDYTKLNEPNSVMSIPYKVLRILASDNTQLLHVTSEKDTVVTADEAHPQHEISVQPDHLDSWSLISCPQCGSVFPENKRQHQPDKRSNICPNCVGTINKNVKLLSGLINKAVEQNIIKQVTDVGQLFSGKMTALSALLSKETMTMLRPYSNRQIDDIPLELTGKLIVEMQKAIIDKINDKPETTATEKSQKEDTSIPIYAVVTKYLKMLSDCYIKTLDKTPSRAEQNKIIKRFNSANYSCRIIKDNIKEVKFIVGDPLVAYIITLTTTALTWGLDHSKNNEMITRVICPTIGYDRYIPNQNDMDHQTFKALKERLKPKEYENSCILYELTKDFPRKDNIIQTIENIVADLRSENKLSDKDQKLLLTPSFVLMNKNGKSGTIGNLTSENELHYRVVLYYEDKEQEQRLKNNKETILEKLKKATGLDNLQLLISPVDSSHILYSLDGFYFESESVEPFSFEQTEENNDDYEGDITDLLSYETRDSFFEICESKGLIPDEQIVKLLQESITDFINKNKPTTQTTMEMPASSSPLEETNITSDNPALADKTTRELLHELKIRGVLFDNLTVPVRARRVVSLDEI